jgi:hypothetical protein
MSEYAHNIKTGKSEWVGSDNRFGIRITERKNYIDLPYSREYVYYWSIHDLYTEPHAPWVNEERFFAYAKERGFSIKSGLGQVHPDKYGILFNFTCHHGEALPSVSGEVSVFWNGKGIFLEVESLKTEGDEVSAVIGCTCCHERWAVPLADLEYLLTNDNVEFVKEDGTREKRPYLAPFRANLIKALEAEAEDWHTHTIIW